MGGDFHDVAFQTDLGFADEEHRLVTAGLRFAGRQQRASHPSERVSKMASKGGIGVKKGQKPAFLSKNGVHRLLVAGAEPFGDGAESLGGDAERLGGDAERLGGGAERLGGDAERLGDDAE